MELSGAGHLPREPGFFFAPPVPRGTGGLRLDQVTVRLFILCCKCEIDFAPANHTKFIGFRRFFPAGRQESSPNRL